MSIALNHITLSYGSRTLLEDVTAAFAQGSLTALIGRNGTGKSTLLRTVAGLARPQAGYITVNGRRTDTMSRREIAAAIAFVSTEEVKVENLKVTDVVALGRAPYTNWVGSLTEEDRAQVARALALVGMQAFAGKGIGTLSDGERQRVMIARALAQDTPIILLDEPTAFLDLPNKYEIGLLLRRLAHDEGKCIVFSTHDLAIALELCDTIALLEGGRFHYGTTDMLVESGDLGRLFRDTALTFDPDTRSVRLRGE